MLKSVGNGGFWRFAENSRVVWTSFHSATFMFVVLYSHHDRHHHRRHHIVVQHVVQRGNNAASSSVLGMLAQGFNAWDGAQRHSSFCSSLWERSFRYHCFGHGRTDVIFPPSPHPLPDPNSVVRLFPRKRLLGKFRQKEIRPGPDNFSVTTRPSSSVE